MQALRSLFRLRRGRGALLALAGLGLAYLQAFDPTQLKEQSRLSPLPRVELDPKDNVSLWTIRQEHPRTIFLPESLSDEVLEQVYRCLPNYEKYSIDGNKVCMINGNHEYEEFVMGHNQEDWLHYALNFNNPPRSFTKEQFNALLPRLENDQCIVLTFIPSQESYAKWVGPIQPHDRYSVSKMKNLLQLTEEFKRLKCNSPTTKAQYMIVASDDLAKRLNISYHNVGDVYVLRKTSPLMNNESNFIYEGIRCHMQKVEPAAVSDVEADFSFKLKFLREACLPYVNQVNLVNDFRNFFRVAQKSDSGRLLVVLTGEDEKAEFQQRIDKVLFELKKVFKEDLSIMVTKNKQLLRNELHINPDEFVTLRLVNLKSIQKPLNLFGDYSGLEGIVSQQKPPVYTRHVYKGPFRYSELVEFIRNPSGEYYENKDRLKLIRPILPKDLYEVNGLVLYEKAGCTGCSILNAVLEELENVVREIETNGPNCQEYTFKYKITDPERLKNLRIYRYNILNEHSNFKSPLTTPQLYYFREGKQQSLSLNRQEDFTDPKETLRKIVQFLSEL